MLPEPGAAPMPRFVGANEPADLSVLMVSYNTVHLLERCFAALRRASQGLRVQVVVVDNASRDGSVLWLREWLPDATVLCNETNVGFGRANNQALERCRGRYLLLLNTDAFVSAQTLHESLRFMDGQPKCGVLGVKLVGSDGEPQPSCRFFPTPWNAFLQRTGLQRLFPGAVMVDKSDWDANVSQECDWVPGCFYLVRVEVIQQVGLFDPRFFLYYEEVDHCAAVKAASWSVMYFAGATVVHLGGESAKADGTITDSGRQASQLQIESELLYFRKHHGRAGVWVAMILGTLADLVTAARSLLKLRGTRHLGGVIGHLADSWWLFVRTHFGRRATR